MSSYGNITTGDNAFIGDKNYTVGNVHIGDNVHLGDNVYINNSKTINFTDCVFNFGDELSQFAKDLKQSGRIAESEQAESIAKEIGEIRGTPENTVVEVLESKGVISRIGDFIKKIGTKNITGGLLMLYRQLSKAFPKLPQLPE